MPSMRLYFIIILNAFICSTQTNAQTEPFVTRTEFENQGEQEDYWAEKFFYENYRKQNWKKYPNNVYVETSSTNKFDSTYIQLFADSKDLGSIFKLGILFPDLFIHDRTNGDTLKIGSVEELKFLKLPHTKKRFRLWFYGKKLTNPTVYLFELTNEHASPSTHFETFIKQASLTFFKQGWVII